MRPRFFVPDLDAHRTEADLPPEESHHLARVLRLRVGDEVEVFDGRGLSMSARVSAAGRDAARVLLLSTLPANDGPSIALTLVQSVLKPDAMDGVIRDSTMIGVAAIQPVISEHTTVKIALLPKAGERWRRIVLASAKQCGRSVLPEVREPMAWGTWLAGTGAAGAFLLVEPRLAPASAVKVAAIARRPRPPSASIVVGPEGGWTEAEREQALAAGCVPLTLGRLTLRAEAVPLAAAAALLAIWDE